MPIATTMSPGATSQLLVTSLLLLVMLLLLLLLLQLLCSSSLITHTMSLVDAADCKILFKVAQRVQVLIRDILGLYKDNGKEHGNYYNGLYRVYIGVILG